MQLGFIGLGVQGKHLALNLRVAEHSVIVYDLAPEPLAELAAAGATVAASPREVAIASDIVAICVRDDAQVLDVVLGENGVLAGIRRDAILVIHSTVSHQTIMSLVDYAAKVGAIILDAPVSGGEQGAMRRSMSFMVGGPVAAVERCAPLFAASGPKVTHTGEVGTAIQAKIVHQLITCINMMAAHEGMTLGLKAGLSPDILTKVVHEGAAQSFIADRWLASPIGARAIDVFKKDLELCLSMAEQLHVDVPGTRVAEANIAEILA